MFTLHKNGNCIVCLVGNLTRTTGALMR